MRCLIRPQAQSERICIVTHGALTESPSLTVRRRTHRRPSYALQATRARIAERNRRAFEEGLRNIGRALSRNSRARPMSMEQRRLDREIQLDNDATELLNMMRYRGAK